MIRYSQDEAPQPPPLSLLTQPWTPLSQRVYEHVDLTVVTFHRIKGRRDEYRQFVYRTRRGVDRPGSPEAPAFHWSSSRHPDIAAREFLDDHARASAAIYAAHALPPLPAPAASDRL